MYDIRGIFTNRFIIEPHLWFFENSNHETEQETTQYQRCASISTTSCWGATVLWRCLLFWHWSTSFTKHIFLVWQKKLSPFLYMAIHRPPLAADEERLTSSSCPTRFVLGPLLCPSQWQRNIVEQCARHWEGGWSWYICRRSVLETCTPLTVWTFRR